jgi:hypothetical protein
MRSGCEHLEYLSFAFAAQDCDLHPLEPIVASSLIDGRLLISHFDIAAGTSDRKHSIKASCKKEHRKMLAEN